MMKTRPRRSRELFSWLEVLTDLTEAQRTEAGRTDADRTDADHRRWRSIQSVPEPASLVDAQFGSF